MWKKKFNFLHGYLLEPINRVNRFIPGWQTHAIETLVPPKNGRDIDNLIEKYQPLNFTSEEEIKGEKVLNKFGLKNGDKFVCLAVRDGAYQQQKISSRYRDWSYHDYRNQDIDNYILAAEELTKRGYYIFRMGVVANKPFKSNNPKIIDYVNSNLRSDFMDVYLGAKCTFCISTGYGFDELPYIFRRPIAYLTIPLGTLYSYSEKFLLLTKHHILKKEKRRLSLSEIFSYGVAYAMDTKIFRQKGIELVDNTPNEIKDMAIEMAENLETKKKLNPEDDKLQKTFKKLYASMIQRIDYHGNEKITHRKFHGQIRCRFSTKFLRENKNWLR
jgi:putative glycosyltransferase (TIGR04372 family)